MQSEISNGKSRNTKILPHAIRIPRTEGEIFNLEREKVIRDLFQLPYKVTMKIPPLQNQPKEEVIKSPKLRCLDNQGGDFPLRTDVWQRTRLGTAAGASVRLIKAGKNNVIS